MISKYSENYFLIVKILYISRILLCITSPLEVTGFQVNRKDKGDIWGKDWGYQGFTCLIYFNFLRLHSHSSFTVLIQKKKFIVLTIPSIQYPVNHILVWQTFSLTKKSHIFTFDKNLHLEKQTLGILFHINIRKSQVVSGGIGLQLRK